MKKIVWEKVAVNEDDLPIGHIYVTIISPRVYADLVAEGLTDDQICGNIAADMMARGQQPKSSVHRGNITDANIPNNAGAAMEYVVDEDTETVSQEACQDQIRCFRDCWKWDGTKIIEDNVMVLDKKKSKVRAVRNRLLELSDKDEFRLTGQDLANVKTYRQSLRDLGPNIENDPDNVPWPTKPSV